MATLYHEDLDWLIRCCAAGYVIRFLPEPLEIYTVRPGSYRIRRHYADPLTSYVSISSMPMRWAATGSPH